MRKTLLVISAIVFCASLSAYAQNSGSVRYKWTDNQGLAHFSDSLTSEAMKYGYELVNDRGLVVQRVSRQLNVQERAAANKLAAEQAAKDRAIQEQANADAQMLNAYPDEDAYKISLQQALETFDQQLNTTRINLRSQERALTELLGRAADVENGKDAVPKFLVDSIAKQRNVVANLRDTMQRQQALRARSVQQQAKQMTHYREVRAAQKQPEE